jgi:hypothetical protein
MYDSYTLEPLRYADGVQYLSYLRVESETRYGDLSRMLVFVEVFTPVSKRLLALGWDKRAGAPCQIFAYHGPGGLILTTPPFGGRPGYLGLLPPLRYGAGDIQVLALPVYGGESPTEPRVGPKAAFFELRSGASSTVAMDLASRGFALHAPPKSENPVPYGEGAVASGGGEGTFFPASFQYLGPEGSRWPLLKAEAGRFIFGHAVDRKQGDALVWLEGPDVGGFGGALQMWTAPFALPPAEPQRRAVMKDAKSSGGFGTLVVAHEGLALFVRGPGEAHLVRLSDGLGWLLHPDDGTGFTRPLGITDEHVILYTGPRDSPTGPVGGQDSLVRYARKSLGPPTEPNGL